MIKRIAQAWAFAAIVLLPNYIDLTSSTGDARMRVATPLTRIALAHLTDMATVAVLFALVMAGLRRLKAWPAVRWTLLALLPVLLLVRNLNVFPFDVPDAAVLAVSVVWVGLLVFLLWRAPKAAASLGRAGSGLLAGFACFALVMTWQLGRAALWRPGPQAYSSTISAPPASRPRLVWILFDELAYKPVFEARDPSLQLPNFDRLRAESTLYTDIDPIGYRTTHVVPGLMLGRKVTDVTYTADNRYLIQTEDRSGWQRFDVNASLFGLAHARGVTTSIVGWYIAYCPVYVHVATECTWSNEDTQDRGPTSLQASYAENVWFPLRTMVEQVVAPRRAWTDVANWDEEGHIASVQDLTRHALQTLATSQADILYLHLPAPHPPAFWNRHTGRFGTGGSYLDSLAYTDQLLGRILDVLQAQPRWASTTLLVQGDHSWRTKMWRPLPGWSAEDERASHGGQWDPRPLLIIHAPGQQSAQTVATPTSEMMIHGFVAAQIQALAR